MHFKLASGGGTGDGTGGDSAIKVELMSIQTSSYKTDVNILNYNIFCWRLYFLHFCEYLQLQTSCTSLAKGERTRER